MKKVVGIRFQKEGKMLYYDAASLQPSVGDYVIAETDRSQELAEVILGVNELPDSESQEQLPRIIRIATPQDIQQATEIRAKEREAYHICQKKIAEHNLEMKLVSVESSFDNGKMLFYFTANGRVDFRALVKDLASTFKTRIELRQIGVRDEARMLGGLGPCGRPICCGAFLNDFQPVSIKMAKEQNLSLNPTKISGVCGRLMCCLKYEQDQYEKTRKRMPRIGREVSTPDGPGTVTALNIVKETVSVRIPSGDASEIKEYTLEQLSGSPEKRAEAENDQAETTDWAPEAQETAVPAQESADASGKAADPGQPEPKEKAARSGSRPAKNRKGRPDRKNPKAGPKEETAAEGSGDPRAQSRNSRREKTAGKEQHFGQPVRRENPERVKKSDAPESAAQTPSKSEAPVKDSASGNAKSRGWADALERAMHAADS